MAKAKKAVKATKAAPKASSKSDNGKTYAIVAHISWLGWILALILDKDKDPLARYYLRQTLILYLALFLSWIPFIGWIVGLVVLVFWVISLIGAINGEKKEVPLVGKLAQDWFKGL
jgi:uncharacterized membrane protein